QQVNLINRAWFSPRIFPWKGEQMKKLKVLINGGGIAGCFAALLLGRDGHKVKVFEKRVANKSTKLSVGQTDYFTLSERGRYCLRWAGLFDKAMNLSVPLNGRLVHVPLLPWKMVSPYGSFDEDILHSISRSGLHS